MEKTNAKGSVSKKAVKAVAPVKKSEVKEVKEVKAAITSAAEIIASCAEPAIKESSVKAVKVEKKENGKKQSAGAQVRELFENIPADKLDLKLLTDAAKCKEQFKLQYAFLKPVTKNDDDRKINGYPRYAKTPIILADKKYWITNNIFKQHIDIFKNYLASLVK